MPEFLACVGVRKMHLDCWQGNRSQCIPDSNTCMCVCRWVNQYGVKFAFCLAYGIYNIAFDIGLDYMKADILLFSGFFKAAFIEASVTVP